MLGWAKFLFTVFKQVKFVGQKIVLRPKKKKIHVEEEVHLAVCSPMSPPTPRSSSAALKWISPV